MRELFVALLCAALLSFGVHARAEEHGGLVRCEYSEGGGMENHSLFMALVPGREADVLAVEEQWGGRKKTARYQTSPYALDDLGAYVAAYAPETWADLPLSELIALDAPTRSLRVIYADGSAFAITDSKELPEDSGPLLWDVARFLESYTVKDAQTCEIRRPSSEDGPTLRLTLSAPEKVAWYSYEQEHEACDAASPGAGYDVVYVFRGRIPGEVTAVFQTSDPLAEPAAEEDVEGPGLTLVIDDNYNVTLKEAE